MPCARYEIYVRASAFTRTELAAMPASSSATALPRMKHMGVLLLHMSIASWCAWTKTTVIVNWQLLAFKTEPMRNQRSAFSPVGAAGRPLYQPEHTAALS
eukprot:3385183-Pyramimonas_sp.AAC.1